MNDICEAGQQRTLTAHINRNEIRRTPSCRAHFRPIFVAIEKHRLADAAFDDSLDRGAHESVKEDRIDSEGAALLALLQTKPETLAGCLAVLRYVADWADNNDAGLFQHGNGE
jgi:hypothetical protein